MSRSPGESPQPGWETFDVPSLKKVLIWLAVIAVLMGDVRLRAERCDVGDASDLTTVVSGRRVT
jgi:hypothetical protein